MTPSPVFRTMVALKAMLSFIKPVLKLREVFKNPPAPSSCLIIPPLSIAVGSVMIFILPPIEGAARLTALRPLCNWID